MLATPIAVDWTSFTGDPRWPVGLVVGTCMGVWLFLKGFRTWRQLRLIADTPTSKVRSLALGRVELRGRAAGKGDLSAPLTGASCVYYRFRVEEEVYRNRRRDWRTLMTGSSEAWPFYLEDETGRVLVDATQAELEIDPDLRAVDPPLAGALAAFAAEHDLGQRGGFLGLGRRRLRFTEWHLAPGEPVYLIGVAQDRAGIAHERRVRIAERLAALKSDAAALARLDSDGDGRVSAEEWDVARRLAVQEVELAAPEDRVVIAADASGATPFLISDRDERSLLSARRWRALGGVVGGALLALICWAGLLHRFGVLGRS
jgi:hypothetical protein